MAQFGQIPGGGRVPYGDIFTVNTPSLDRFGKQLYEEQLLRKRQQDLDMKALDAEFAKNMSGMKDADIPELTKAYGDFKLKTQMLMRQKGGGTPEQQLDVLRSKASVYDIINKSKLQREEDHALRKDMIAHPDRYDDNASNYLRERINTPTSQLGVSKQYKDDKGNYIDLVNGKSYLYKGTDFDFGTALKKAAGTIKNTGYEQREKLPGGLGDMVTQYQFSNNPLVFKDQLLGQLATNKGGRAAGPLWDAIPEDRKILIDQMYEDIPLEKWEKMTGKKERPPLIVFNPDNKAEQLANFYAKIHAIQNEPTALKSQQLYDKSAIMDRQEAERKEAASLRFERAKKLIELNRGYGEGMNFDVIGNYIPRAEVIPEKKDFSGKIIQPEQVVIKVKDIDPYDYKTITNNGKVYPKVIDKEEVYILDKNNGDLIGEGGQRISRESVARQRSKETPNTLYKRGMPPIGEPPKNKLGTTGATKKSTNKWDQYKRPK